tara:strand:+ start:18 stop:569 length:552 start_codon:yes stop_codon:yes gene_type:complete
MVLSEIEKETISKYKSRMVHFYFSDDQVDNTFAVGANEEDEEQNTLDLITCSYKQEINYPVPRYINLVDIDSKNERFQQVKKWYINPTNKWLVIELTQGYWKCWYEGYWKPKYGNRKTDVAQSCWLQFDKFEIWVTPCNYALDNEYKIEDIEYIKSVPIDQVALQTGHQEFVDEIFNPLLYFN